MNRADEYERLHRSPEIRAQLVKKLEDLLERYPMMRTGQLIANAIVIEGRLFNIEDDQFLRELDQLAITYGQLTAAGIKKEQL